MYELRDCWKTRAAALLSGFVPINAREISAMADMVEALTTPFAPGRNGSQLNDIRHFTVSAAIWSNDHILLLQHKQFIPRRFFPGGHTEHADSSPIQTALRETYEECRVYISESTFVGLMGIDVLNGAHGHKHLDMTLGFLSNQRVQPTKEDEFSGDVDWLHVEEARICLPNRLHASLDRLISKPQYIDLQRLNILL